MRIPSLYIEYNKYTVDVDLCHLWASRTMTNINYYNIINHVRLMDGYNTQINY